MNILLNYHIGCIFLGSMCVGLEWYACSYEHKILNIRCSLPCPHILGVGDFQPVTTKFDNLLIYLLQGAEFFLRC